MYTGFWREVAGIYICRARAALKKGLSKQAAGDSSEMKKRAKMAQREINLCGIPRANIS